jgi:hypothetical protein
MFSCVSNVTLQLVIPAALCEALDAHLRRAERLGRPTTRSRLLRELLQTGLPVLERRLDELAGETRPQRPAPRVVHTAAGPVEVPSQQRWGRPRADVVAAAVAVEKKSRPRKRKSDKS